MSSNISWMGNKVIDPTTPRPMQQPLSTTPSQMTTPGTPTTPSAPPTTILPGTQQGPPPSTERGYIPYYLASNIGKNVRAEFIIGTSQYADRTGILTEVGINYFVLRDVNSRTDIMCDLYSVKFVTVLLSL